MARLRGLGGGGRRGGRSLSRGGVFGADGRVTGRCRHAPFVICVLVARGCGKGGGSCGGGGGGGGGHLEVGFDGERGAIVRQVGTQVIRVYVGGKVDLRF